MYRIGLDMGSSYSKGVLVDADNKIVDCFAVKTGYDFLGASQKIIEKLAAEKKVEYPAYTCGYGRERVNHPFVPRPELIALARAVHEEYKREAVVFDIGGQDTKYVKIAKDGNVDKFKMNRKCAAGTGSFLEEIAFRLGVMPESFNELAKEATEEVRISSFCTVFAISEIIGMIKKGVSLPNIAMGIYNCIIERVLELSPPGEFIVLTGGVPATHPVFVELFKKNHPNVVCPPRAQFMAAYGCVILNDKKSEVSDEKQGV